MSCKHEFIQEEWIVEVCKKCDKLRAQTVFEDELAAANARIAELEQHFEQAKDKIAMMGAEIVRLSEGKEQAEAQNKRLQTAINRYVIGNIELLDAMKAALEEKP